ncbi:MAG: iron ABC transporter permease [Oscillospiraceae bacterium]
MRKVALFISLIIACIVILVLAMGIGSVPIAPIDCINIIIKKLFDIELFGAVNEISQSILLKIRIPRTLLAFVSGSGLAVSGVMMQSVLRNPLASSFTLGVSSGAALGASVAILFGISIFGFLTLPIFGLTAGLITVFLALGVAAKVDRNLQNNSIILTGMAFSLFANAAITIIMALSKEQLQRLVYWQMGSFATKTPSELMVLFPIIFIGCAISLRCARQMDIMTLGDEQAQTSGVEVKKMKWILLSLSAVITGSVVSLVGIIGFVDLFTPHAARKLFGASHKYVIPASVLLGGAFMVLCDLIARTIVAPLELPVGAITSAIGAPFFIYLYFSRRKKAK